MFCENCGKQLPDNANFCDGCGKKLTAVPVPVKTPAQTKAAAPASPQNANIQPQQPQTVNYRQSAPAQQSYQQQPNYTQNTYNPNAFNAGGNPPALTVGQYIATFILSAIPFIGFILMLVWAFDSGTNLNKKNYARAVLLLLAIGIAASILISIIGGSIIIELLNEL